MELYRQFRPTNFAEVKGQDRAINLLKDKIKKKELPHVILLVGPTGCGKTTIARILSGVAASPIGSKATINITETDCADERGMDLVRNLETELRYPPIGGGNKVFIWDEVVQLPKATQQVALKTLEDPPNFAYFILTASTTGGLLETFLGRCFVINLETLSKVILVDIMDTVLRKSSQTIEWDVIPKIAEVCNGSARKALQLLEAALSGKTAEERMNNVLLATCKEEEKAEFLAKILLKRPLWSEITKITKTIETKDLETLRRQVLAYATKVLEVKPFGDPLAYLVIRAFQDDWISSGKAGLLAACWECRQK